MKQRLHIWWIDDEEDRLVPAARRAIEKPTQPSLKRCSCELRVKQVQTEEAIRDVIVELTEANADKSNAMPDLIVIDQTLNVRSKEGLIQCGSSIAVTLRAQVPSVPLVGVTGAKLEDIASLQRDQFVEFVSRGSVNKGDCIPDLYAIADGFSRLQENASQLRRVHSLREVILGLIVAPRDDAELLFTCIPGEFKAPWDAETPHAFARWVWHVLMGRPGFLYDDLEVATLMGLKESGLNRVAQQLMRCKYDGAFASSSRRRWWASKVRATIRKLTNASAADPLSTLGRKLIGFDHRSEFSKCYGSDAPKDCIPNVVAYKDERCDLSNRVQARIEDTVVVATDTPPLGFEQRRRFA